MNILALLILIPFVAAFFVFVAGNKSAKYVALGAAVIELIAVCVLLTKFDPEGGRQFVIDYPWITSMGIQFKAGVDGISLIMVMLTAGALPLIILASYKHNYSRSDTFYALVLLMQGAMIGVFTILDGFLFYVFWELALIPIWFIALIWGGKESGKITLKFFIYTLFGSLLMLFALIWLYLQTPGAHTFDIDAFYALDLSVEAQYWLFGAFLIAFGIKIPIFPLHTWQPDTYTQTTAPGTMLLSGIMLKMGLYGLFRLMLPIAPVAVTDWNGPVVVLCVIGIIYASIIALRQYDLKRLAAYVSIAHVGLIAAGILAMSPRAWEGALIQMLSHGINVIGLFFIIDLIELRTGTRDLRELGGLRQAAPKLATCFMIIVFGSIALPLTNGFVGEFLLLTGLFEYEKIVGAVAGLTIILGAAYMLRAYGKSALGAVNDKTKNIKDLTFIESAVLFPIVILIILIGVYPKPIFDIIQPAVNDFVNMLTSLPQ